MDNIYQQTAQAATASLNLEAKERIVNEMIAPQERLKNTLSQLGDVRAQYRKLQEENVMLRKYRDNLVNAASASSSHREEA